MENKCHKNGYSGKYVTILVNKGRFSRKIFLQNSTPLVRTPDWSPSNNPTQ